MFSLCRDVDGTQEQIDRAMISMRDVGFINYFGMQRFGNSQVATHLVGRLVPLAPLLQSPDTCRQTRTNEYILDVFLKDPGH